MAKKKTKKKTVAKGVKKPQLPKKISKPTPKPEAKPQETPKHEENQSSEQAEKPIKQGFFKRLFPRKRNLEKHIKSFEKLNEKEKVIEKRREVLRKKLFKPEQQKKKKKPRKRFKLKDLLVKAGLKLSSSELKKRIFIISLIITLVLTIAIVVSAILGDKDIFGLLLFLAGFLTAGFGLIIIVVSLGAATVIDVKIHNRKQQVEEVLPDYLQLTAANIGAGMTIDRALWYAVRPRFGVLAKEIEDVAKRVITGEELNVALKNFASQYDSATLKRSINLLLEGVEAGGKIANLLHNISVDIQEQRILQREMSANVMTYVIFIAFASVGAAPFLFGLSTELLIVIKSIAGNIGSNTGSSSAFSISPDVIKLRDFQIFSSTTLVISSTFSAMIISVIRKGSVVESLRFIPMFVAISLVIYFVAVWFFAQLFGGLIA